MHKRFVFIILFLVLNLGASVVTQAQTITTIAGTGVAGFSGDGGSALSADLFSPVLVTLDANGNLFFSDNRNHRIRRIDALTGIITTVAGSGPVGPGPGGFGGDGGLATSATLNFPNKVAFDLAGNLFFADNANHRIRRIDAVTGIITTVAGTGTAGFSGDGGLALNAELFGPTSLLFDSNGNMLVADQRNHRIRKIDAITGIITTIAGSGSAGPGPGGFSGDNGPAINALLYHPGDIVIDAQGNLLFTDQGNNRIRKIQAATGIITTIAGIGPSDPSSGGFAGDGGPATNAQFFTPSALTLDSNGNLFVCDHYNNRVRMINTAGIITTVAGSGPTGIGTGSFGGDGGPATSALLHQPNGVVVSALGKLFIADQGNQRIRTLNQPPNCSGASIADQSAGTNCQALISGADVSGVTDPDNDNLVITVNPTTLSLGVNSVTVTADDGNGGTCSTIIIVNVVDNAAPVPNVANLPDAIGECSVTLTAPTATDNCAGSITATTSDPLIYNTQGTFTVIWAYNDGNGNTCQQTQKVIVDDITAPTPNVANLPDIVGECNATINSTPMATDNCAGSITATTIYPLIYNTQGTFTVTWTYNDGNGNTCQQTQKVIVDDITAPTLTVNSTPITLWPPNHQYVTINVSQCVTSISDNCNSLLSISDVVITQVSSDEPEDARGGGDGSTTNDIVITSCSSVKLRAEREGSGNGRVYRIHLQVSDGNGNSTTATCQVHVPKSQNGNPAVDDGAAAGYIVTSSCGSAPKFSSNLDNNAKLEIVIPGDYALEQNYPNPFNPETEIRFQLPQDSHVLLKLFNTLGREILTLADGQYQAGYHRLRWNGKDAQGNPLASGVYLYQLRAGGFSQVRKMSLLR